MLARGRFKTETPNVIDPGEETPSRPARIETNSESPHGSISVGGRSTASRHYQKNGFDDPNSATDSDGIMMTTSRPQQTNKGSISRGVRIDYVLDADDEPGFNDSVSEDDVETNGSSPRGGQSCNTYSKVAQPPPKVSEYESWYGPSGVGGGSLKSTKHSIEQSRLFAAAMLNKSDRHLLGAQQQQQQKQLRQEESVLQKMIRGTRMYNHNDTNSTNMRDEIYILEDTGGVHTLSPKRFRRRTICRMVVLVVAVAVVLSFSVVAIQSGRNRGGNNGGGGGGGGGGDDTSTSAGQSNPVVDDNLAPRLQSIIEFLVDHEVSMSTHLYDGSSPQHRAAYWIANIDPEQLAVPDNTEVLATPINFVQRYTLAVLYFSWKGDKVWTHSLDFTAGTHECGWFQTMTDAEGDEFAMGVGCDQELQVRSLLLPSNNITGSIPDEIQHLSKLDLLNLEQNALTGSIPASLNKLTLLEYLDLNFNRLTGSIPSWLGTSLGSLKVLGLGHNSLYGSIPETLSSGELSTNLKTLALDNNMLSGDALTIQRLKNLEYLYLSNNDLSGQLEHGLLSDMPSLIEVDLSHNRFSGAIPYHLFLTQSLRVLDLGSNKFSGSLPSRTGTIQNVLLDQSKMEFLSLRNNSISSTIPDSLLGHLSSLTYLDLSINVLDGTYPRTLGGLNGLTCLLLGNNSFDAGPVPEILQSLTNLEELSLDSLQLEGALPTWLQDFGRLKLLDLSKNRLIGSISLDFEALPDLTFLMLHDNLLTGSLPGSIGSLQNLIVLSIHDNNVTGDVGILCADDTSLELVTIDCNVTVCPCCTSCCDSDDCFKDYEWDTLKHNDGAWEEDFQRAEYAFNPMIITTAGKH